jgi:hypothetical protein
MTAYDFQVIKVDCDGQLPARLRPNRPAAENMWVQTA